MQANFADIYRSVYVKAARNNWEGGNYCGCPLPLCTSSLNTKESMPHSRLSPPAYSGWDSQRST